MAVVVSSLIGGLISPTYGEKTTSKGEIVVGKDADLCFLNNQLDITDVILNGEFGMKDQVIIKKGRYEK